MTSLARKVSARIHTTSEVETNKGVDKGDMKDLEGYFDNLDSAAVNEKSFMEKLFTNSAKLTATNK